MSNENVIHDIEILWTTHKKFAIGSWAIKRALKTDYSHIIIRDRATNRCFEAIGKGVSETPFEEVLKKDKIIKRATMLEAFPDMSQEDMRKGIEFCEQEVADDTPYGFFTNVGIFIYEILRLGVKLFRDGNASFICSELARVAFPKQLDAIKGSQDYCDPKDLDVFIFGKLLDNAR